jgi:hypothetical protein
MAAPTIFQGVVQTLVNQTGYFTFDNGGPQLARIPYTVGTVTLNGATPVSITGVPITASSDINFTLKTVGGTVGASPAIQTITVGAAGSVTVAGTAGDTSVYTYTITG